MASKTLAQKKQMKDSLGLSDDDDDGSTLDDALDFLKDDDDDPKPSKSQNGASSKDDQKGSLKSSFAQDRSSASSSFGKSGNSSSDPFAFESPKRTASSPSFGEMKKSPFSFPSSSSSASSKDPIPSFLRTSDTERSLSPSVSRGFVAREITGSESPVFGEKKDPDSSTASIGSTTSNPHSKLEKKNSFSSNNPSDDDSSKIGGSDSEGEDLLGMLGDDGPKKPAPAFAKIKFNRGGTPASSAPSSPYPTVRMPSGAPSGLSMGSYSPTAEAGEDSVPRRRRGASLFGNTSSPLVSNKVSLGQSAPEPSVDLSESTDLSKSKELSADSEMAPTSLKGSAPVNPAINDLMRQSRVRSSSLTFMNKKPEVDDSFSFLKKKSEALDEAKKEEERSIKKEIPKESSADPLSFLKKKDSKDDIPKKEEKLPEKPKEKLQEKSIEKPVERAVEKPHEKKEIFKDRDSDQKAPSKAPAVKNNFDSDEDSDKKSDDDSKVPILIKKTASSISSSHFSDPTQPTPSLSPRSRAENASRNIRESFELDKRRSGPDNMEALRIAEDSMKERARLSKELEEATLNSMKATQSQHNLNSELVLEKKKSSQEIYNQKTAYEDKILALKTEISKMSRDNVVEVATLRDTYDERMQVAEVNHRKDKQILVDAETSLRKRLEAQLEQSIEDRRAMQKSYEEIIQKLREERDRETQSSRRKIEEEIAHSVALHKDALLTKERQFAEAMDTQKKIHQQELLKFSRVEENKESLTQLSQDIHSSVATMKSVQDQLDIERISALADRESTVKIREKELRRKEEALEKVSYEVSRDREKVQKSISDLNAQLRDLATSNDDEKKRLTSESAQLESRRTAFEIEKRSLREAVEKEQRELIAARERKIREQEQHASDLADERRQLAEERRVFSEISKRLHDNDEGSVRRLQQKEKSLDLERQRFIQEKAEFDAQISSAMGERNRIMEERASLDRELQAFKQETTTLTKMAENLHQKSEEVAFLHEEVVNERLKAEEMKDEAETFYLKAAAERAKVSQQENVLLAQRKAHDQQRLEIMKERKKVTEEQIAISRSSEIARKFSRSTGFSSPLRKSSSEDANSLSSSMLEPKKAWDATSEFIDSELARRDAEDSQLSKSIEMLQSYPLGQSLDRSFSNQIQKWSSERESSKNLLNDQTQFLSSLYRDRVF